MLYRKDQICRKNETRPASEVARWTGSFYSRQSGVTLIELVLVIIIVGVLAAVAAPRLRGTSGFEDRGFYDETIAALRYAQKSAIAQRRLVCVTFTAKSLTLTIASANPAGTCNSDLKVTGSSGATPYVLDTTSSAVDPRFRNTDLRYNPVPAALQFNPSGSPSAASSITIVNTGTGETFPSTITVEAETGYVH